jgi:hypothetical protein
MNTDEKDKEDHVIASEQPAQSEAKGSLASEAISTPERRLLHRDPEKNIGTGEHAARTCTCGTGAGNDTKESILLLWLARLLIAIVVAWNLQCALVFMLTPGVFAPGFELSGIPGEAAVRGFAVLFVMWNIPYLVALWQPRRHRLSLWEALAMQVVGLIGESLILFSLPTGYPSLHISILRFIAFDAAGVGLLSIAVFLSHK